MIEKKKGRTVRAREGGREERERIPQLLMVDQSRTRQVIVIQSKSQSLFFLKSSDFISILLMRITTILQFTFSIQLQHTSKKQNKQKRYSLNF